MTNVHQKEKKVLGKVNQILNDNEPEKNCCQFDLSAGREKNPRKKSDGDIWRYQKT